MERLPMEDAFFMKSGSWDIRVKLPACQREGVKHKTEDGIRTARSNNGRAALLF